MLTDKDIKKMQKVFATAEDHVNLEDKTDNLTELVEKLPTRDDMERMLDRTFGLTTIKTEYDRMKKALRERFNINVEVEV